MKRPTIADVALRAGVTKAAVSFALNDQPGVSAATRERILAIAAEVGFQPSSAARALSGGRAQALGLVIERPGRVLGVEPYFMQLISGIQSELAGQHLTLLFTLAEDHGAEISLYRGWWAQRRVDGVFLVDLEVEDPRVPVLEGLGMPAFAIGAPQAAGTLPAVAPNTSAAAETAIGHLAGLGHRRIGRVAGRAHYWHTGNRAETVAAACAQRGIELVTVSGDYSRESGARATHELLSLPVPPTAILYDNDIMAVAGLAEAQRLGVQVPGQVSIMAWDDSILCELVHPALTALRHDISGVGAAAARRLTQLAAGGPAEGFTEPAPTLMSRGSTAPVRGRG
ncbi:MAG: LacI family DNA-binding transcriptional regulator [Actinobacteria bacterium]|nr:LacI family DNA-binding transcriptional regulator [Actinomycetota bacterium]